MLGNAAIEQAVQEAPMKHRKSISAEQMRRAALKACGELSKLYNGKNADAERAIEKCLDAIRGLPVVFDTLNRLDPVESAVVDAAMSWAEKDAGDTKSQKALLAAADALRTARGKK
jgi:hypothetical protein